MPTQLPYARHSKELEVYKRQRKLSREVFRLSVGFPAPERYSLTDQLRRAARSVGAQMDEAWAKRLYPKHFVSKLTDADDEQLETQDGLMQASDGAYLAAPDAARLLGLCEEIGRMLGSMIRKAESFASSDYYSLHDEPPPYLTNSEKRLPADPQPLPAVHYLLFTAY